MTRFDPNVDDPHHHLVCRQCGRVRDLVRRLSRSRHPGGADLGFEVGSAEIVFRGLCPECRPTDAGARVRSKSRAPSTDVTRRTPPY